ncbi:hypothetical protein JCM11251_003936 [Rhodosporidiobolus azoricus]
MPAATTKDKTVSLKGDQAEDLILSYLKEQNRPYGATDISANLKNRVSNPQAKKALAALLEKGEIMGKVYGKTTVYCALQEGDADLSTEDLASIDEQNVTLVAEEQKLKEELKVLAVRKAEAMKTLRTSEMSKAVQESEAKIPTLTATLTARRAAVSSSSSSGVDGLTADSTLSAAALLALSQQYTSLLQLATSRRKIALEIEGMLLEGFEKKKGRDEEEVWEMVGGEWGGEAETETWKEVKEVEKVEKEMQKKARAEKGR